MCRPRHSPPPPTALTLPAWRGASGHGIFTGRVSNVDKATGYFTISYEDGDDEELQRDELQKLLAKSAKLPPAAAAAAPPRSGITAKEFASATLHDYMRNTSSAARRKRKHTDLVRRGVFKERAAKERAREAARATADAEAEAVDAAAAACRELYPPPAWAVGMDKEQRALACDGAACAYCAPAPSAEAEEARLESMYRLQLDVKDPANVVVRWWYPPANPGNSNAWICLWHAEEVRWGESPSPSPSPNTNTITTTTTYTHLDPSP